MEKFEIAVTRQVARSLLDYLLDGVLVLGEEFTHALTTALDEAQAAAQDEDVKLVITIKQGDL